MSNLVSGSAPEDTAAEIDNSKARNLAQRFGYFGVLTALVLAAFHQPLIEVLQLSRHSELYSHIPLIPLVTIFLLWNERNLVFSQPGYRPYSGFVLVFIGLLLLLLAYTLTGKIDRNDWLSLSMLGFVLSWIGAFVAIFGTESYRRAVFPLLFLLFVVPIPRLLLDALISFLQRGSTEAANLLFTVSGVPFLRNGFTFALPGMSIEVAPQCSGIRSGLALFITSLLAGHLFLKTGSRKTALAISTIPISMFKNGCRIVTLTLLGTYVDPRILSSQLHRAGGIPFFALALLLLVPVLWLLIKSEKRSNLNRKSRRD